MRFDPFAIDTQRWRLLRAGQAVDLSPRLVEILAYLASRAGDIISKDELLDRFWTDVHVTENTLTRAIADIRKALGDHPDPPQFIQTVARRGYRFIAPIERTPSPQPTIASTSHASPLGTQHLEHNTQRGFAEAALGREGGSSTQQLTDPYLDWVRGRAVLESFDASGMAEAVHSFERAVQGAPDYAPAHVGLANACFLQFERSRVGNVLDRVSLGRAIEHARRGIALDESMGEAWATLGFVLAASGHIEESRAAARHAVAIEPTSWRHHYRLAVATWGEERLRAVDRTLALLPRFPGAYFLAAMVHVARRAFTPAREAARNGATVQLQQAGADGLTLPVAGLHWMSGLIELACGDSAEAARAFERERADARPAQIYGREFLINATVGQGFLYLKQRMLDAARESFLEALEIVPGHARARVGLELIQEQAKNVAGSPTEIASACEDLTRGGKHAEAALVAAACDAWRGHATEACSRLTTLVDRAPPGATGWNLSADPMLAPLHGTPAFESLLARVAGRAA